MRVQGFDGDGTPFIRGGALAGLYTGRKFSCPFTSKRPNGQKFRFWAEIFRK
jgi:hypothetical protein